MKFNEYQWNYIIIYGDSIYSDIFRFIQSIKIKGVSRKIYE